MKAYILNNVVYLNKDVAILHGIATGKRYSITEMELNNTEDLNYYHEESDSENIAYIEDCDTTKIHTFNVETDTEDVTSFEHDERTVDVTISSCEYENHNYLSMKLSDYLINDINIRLNEILKNYDN